ncbi:hypothetical protein ABZW18_14895 [Streptomyces sp. NPDC004647]|uniref:hypothetical protein n=1 Tax=Streptomyces sp. NPDC004647 TaxID=3154671 RepID=UPI0033AEB27A
MCERALARGEHVNEAVSGTVMSVAVAWLFTRTLLSGAAPSTAEQERFVSDVLLQVVTGTPSDS